MWTNTVEIDHDYYNVSIIQKDFNTLEEQMKSDQVSISSTFYSRKCFL